MLHNSLVGEETKVNMYAIHALLDLILTSWETTVTSLILETFAFRETSLVTRTPLFQRQTSSRGNQQNMATIVCHSQTTLLSTHSWPLLPLDSPIHISSHGLADLEVNPVHNVTLSV